MNTRTMIVYNFAILRAVPHVHLGAFCNVGVVVHAPSADFLGIRVLDDAAELRHRLPDSDADLLARYLTACKAVCEGEADAGPIALAAPSERFHWITSPRSDVLQSSPIHEGVAESPRAALDDLFASYVGR